MAQILNKILGHEDHIQNLLKSIKSNKLGSVYLFCGPSGIGKKTVALGMAQELLGFQDTPSHPDLKIIEPDGVQIKIQQAREILDFLSLQKLGPARVIIINEAHTLNIQSANLLLKTLEEPPPDTYFFLITHSEKSILPTIRSRAQILRFSSLSKEHIKTLTQAKDWMILASQGRLDQIELLKNPKLEEVREFVLNFLKNINESYHKDTFIKLKEQLEDKEAALFVALTLQQMIRDIFFLKNQLSPLIHDDYRAHFNSLINLPNEHLHELSRKSYELESLLYGNVDKTLAFENFVLENS